MGGGEGAGLGQTGPDGGGPIGGGGGGRTGPDGWGPMGGRGEGAGLGQTEGAAQRADGRVYTLSSINDIWNLTDTIELKHLKTVAHADNKF
jgi:hypothetical protein